jgi:hypothetical protein
LINLAGLHVDHQAKSQWCWAAVTAGVVNLYRPGRTDQDRVARHFLNARYPEDSAQYLEQVLAGESALRRSVIFAESPPTDADLEQMVRGEIDSGRPVCAEMTFPDRTHYVAISGYLPSTVGPVLLSVLDPEDEDPASSLRTVPLPEFRENYRQDALWSAAFLTRSP